MLQTNLSPFKALHDVPTDGTPVLTRLVYYIGTVLHDAKVPASFYRNGQGELVWTFLEPHPPVEIADLMGWKELEPPSGLA